MHSFRTGSIEQWCFIGIIFNTLNVNYTDSIWFANNLCTHKKRPAWISYALYKLKAATKIRHTNDSILSIAVNKVFIFKSWKAIRSIQSGHWLNCKWKWNKKKIKMLKLIWVLCSCDTSSITEQCQRKLKSQSYSQWNWSSNVK